MNICQGKEPDTKTQVPLPHGQRGVIGMERGAICSLAPQRGACMKIIDYDLKGNVVRFYLGKTTVHDYHGDDWNDILNESGCYPVYREYVSGTADIAFPFNALVLDPCSSEFSYGHRYTKDDMKNRMVPCVIVIPPDIAKTSSEESFSYWAGCKEALRFYFEDAMEPTEGLVTYYFDPAQRQLVRQLEARYVTRMLEDKPQAQGGVSLKQVPIWEKENLTVEEAASYFGIGQNKIRALSDMRNCDFILFVGNKRLIKRKKFAKYLESVDSI